MTALTCRKIRQKSCLEKLSPFLAGLAAVCQGHRPQSTRTPHKQCLDVGELELSPR